jgi:PE family
MTSFVAVLAPELVAAVAPLAAIGGAMTGSNAALAGAHGALLPSSADPTALMATAFLQSHHAMYQGMSAEAIAMHFMTTETVGANGAAYAVSEAGIAGSLL